MAKPPAKPAPKASKTRSIGQETFSAETVTAPRKWQSAPDHPPTQLAYITDAEFALLKKLDMHGSGVDKEDHFGPGDIPSLNGGGSGYGADSSDPTGGGGAGAYQGGWSGGFGSGSGNSSSSSGGGGTGARGPTGPNGEQRSSPASGGSSSSASSGGGGTGARGPTGPNGEARSSPAGNAGGGPGAASRGDSGAAGAGSSYGGSGARGPTGPNGEVRSSPAGNAGGAPGASTRGDTATAGGTGVRGPTGPNGESRASPIGNSFGGGPGFGGSTPSNPRGPTGPMGEIRTPVTGPVRSTPPAAVGGSVTMRPYSDLDRPPSYTPDETKRTRTAIGVNALNNWLGGLFGGQTTTAPAAAKKPIQDRLVTNVAGQTVSVPPDVQNSVSGQMALGDYKNEATYSPRDPNRTITNKDQSRIQASTVSFRPEQGESALNDNLDPAGGKDQSRVPQGEIRNPTTVGTPPSDPNDEEGVSNFISGAAGGTLASPNIGNDQLGAEDTGAPDVATGADDGNWTPGGGLPDYGDAVAPDGMAGTPDRNPEPGRTSELETVRAPDTGGGNPPMDNEDGNGTPPPEEETPVKQLERAALAAGVMPWDMPEFFKLVDRMKKVGIEYKPLDFIRDFYRTRALAQPSYDPIQQSA